MTTYAIITAFLLGMACGAGATISLSRWAAAPDRQTTDTEDLTP